MNTENLTTNNQSSIRARMVYKQYFNDLNINVREQYGQHIAAEDEDNFDFNFKNMDEAQNFYVSIVQQSVKQGTFSIYAAKEIANSLIIYFNK